jgi:hypothetical protein
MRNAPKAAARFATATGTFCLAMADVAVRSAVHRDVITVQDTLA